MASAPTLVWYRHSTGGTAHGFTLPLHPDLANQVKKGLLVPCEAPDPSEANTLTLPPDLVEQVLADEARLGRKKKRAALLKALAELGEDGGEDEDLEVLEHRVQPAAARRLPAAEDEVPGDMFSDEPDDLDAPLPEEESQRAAGSASPGDGAPAPQDAKPRRRVRTPPAGAE